MTGTDRRRLERDGQTRLWWDHTPVDVFLSTHPFHDQAARRLVPHPFAGSVLPFLHPTDLVVFKARFDRPKDRVDITSVVEAGTADLDEAQRWIDVLTGADSDNAVHLRDAVATADRVPLVTPGDPFDRPRRSGTKVCGSTNTADASRCRNPPGCTVSGHR